VCERVKPCSRLATIARGARPRQVARAGVSLGSNSPGHDVVVNATSLGMRPGGPAPGGRDALEPGTLAADVVISSTRTPFLAAAAARGAAVHHGEPMLAAAIDPMLDFILR
jgi:shikimate 5-dehydrogenase